MYKLTNCAYAHDAKKCKYWMNSLLSEGSQRVEEFLVVFQLKVGAMFFFIGQRYDEMSSSLTKLWNKMIVEARHISITNMIDHIKTKMMQDIENKRLSSKKWNTILCPEMYGRQ